MSKMIFISLPVTNLAASMSFYKSLGFENNSQFTDDTSACMVWSEAINVMLLTHEQWRVFTNRPIPPVTSSEVMLALSCDSREAVDAMNKTAAANGGTADINPVQDLGFMYNRNLADPDGHVWEAMWMNSEDIPSVDRTS
ncbi:MAG: lactoylglutathione lyase [Acaryochloridaceae cyanobacterium RU_4_10]|nr:lactoylglutathione lyase [Acaryochloridaceae cyanobacterium RU_4_10]